MTPWNGDNGECYFYQSEFAYGGTVDGSPAYVVDKSVKNHTLRGGGAYFVVDYWDTPPVFDTAFKCPMEDNVQLYPVMGENWGNVPNRVKHTLQRGSKYYDHMVCDYS